MVWRCLFFLTFAQIVHYNKIQNKRKECFSFVKGEKDDCQRGEETWKQHDMSTGARSRQPVLEGVLDVAPVDTDSLQWSMLTTPLENLHALLYAP